MAATLPEVFNRVEEAKRIGQSQRTYLSVGETTTNPTESQLPRHPVRRILVALAVELAAAFCR
jgi:hypothetical protein